MALHCRAPGRVRIARKETMKGTVRSIHRFSVFDGIFLTDDGVRFSVSRHLLEEPPHIGKVITS